MDIMSDSESITASELPVLDVVHRNFGSCCITYLLVLTVSPVC